MKKINVLLVDDETAYLDYLEKELVKHNMIIHRAIGGEAAVVSTQKQDVDVVILDVMMPGIDGFETLKRVKEVNPLIEVILLTDQADLGVAIEGMERGAFDFLFKTIDLQELVYKLTDAHQKKSLQEEKIMNIRHILTQKE